VYPTVGMLTPPSGGLGQNVRILGRLGHQRGTPPTLHGLETAWFLMELSGALSNPQVLVEITSVRRLFANLRSRSRQRRPREVKQRPGLVASTVYNVLATSGKVMRAKHVHLACEELLGQAVSWSAVKASLNEHSKASTSRYLRVGHGRYLLRPVVANQDVGAT
jgi:hypothetical protein